VGDEYVLLGTTSRGIILYLCIVQVQVGDEYVLLGTTSHETILYLCIVQVGDEYVLLGTTSRGTGKIANCGGVDNPTHYVRLIKQIIQC